MTDPQTTAPAVVQALINVAHDLCVSGISKENQMNVGNGRGFYYRSIEAVYAALSPLLAREKLVIKPTRVEFLREAATKSMRLVTIRVSYEIACALDGSTVTAESIGEGADLSDKAVGKAMSYAYKTLMFQLFCIPVEGQDDPDAEVLEPEQPFVSADLLERARATAARGRKALQELWATLSPADMQAIRAYADELKAIGDAADARAKEAG